MLDYGPVIICLVAAAAVIIIARWTARREHYPPGPRGLPLVGNLFDMPGDYSWLTYAAWAHQYSERSVSLSPLNTTHI